MFDYRRTHNCGELRKADTGEHVTLSGWVNRRRDHGGLIFIDLRDRFGITQLVFDPVQNKDVHQKAESLRSEWVISVKGNVRERREGMANPNLPTGDVEIEVSDLEILSKAKTPPFSLSDEQLDVNEELRLKYRYLDMRRGDIANKLKTRHMAMMAIREYLDQNGFLEIATPILGKSTPEGARDYLVPSRIYNGTFYALPQSPQIFKQLLMVGGLDRYFQIAQCFRDEDLRADRQPEFTQVDLEMSFLTPEDLYKLIEGLVKNIFKKTLGIEIKTPFKRMPYEQAISLYGTDKPDLRFNMEMQDLSDIASQSEFSVFKEAVKENNIVKGFKVSKKEFSRKTIDEYTQFVSQFGIKGLAYLKMQDEGLTSSIAKFFNDSLKQELVSRFQLETGDILLMVADAPEKTNQALDHLRRKIAKDLNLAKPDDYQFLWVTDFPLFCYNEEEERVDSMHHPFTSPHVEDLHLIEQDPLKVRSSGYDLVLNGYEIGGGSQRIHSSELQEKIFKTLNISDSELEKKFGFFVEALKYGTPPHLGIALGLDRMLMLITKTENIRDVIAFPKTQKAADLMLDCPSPVTSLQLNELKITIDE